MQQMDLRQKEATGKEHFSRHDSYKKYKVLAALTNYVYAQTKVAMGATLFCASIIFFDFLDKFHPISLLLYWMGFFILIVILRFIMCVAYERRRSQDRHLVYWRNLYIFAATLGGISWGLGSVLLLPHVDQSHQMLMILILAGVTAGVVPLSAAIPSAAIIFLAFSLIPLITTLLLTWDSTYLIFNIAIGLYLMYLMILTIKAYKLIRNSIILQFENDLLLKDLEVSNRQLQKAATHDPLTRVGNRRLFVQNLSEAIEEGKRLQTPFALFFIDLDKFKLANDLYGHHAGDLILVTVIERLAKYFRKTDVIARLGGDELAIIVKDARKKSEIEIIARKICQLVAMPIPMNDVTLQITASIGISLFPQDGQDGDTLLRSADRCMYLAKQGGGNNFYFSSEMQDSMPSPLS